MQLCIPFIYQITIIFSHFFCDAYYAPGQFSISSFERGLSQLTGPLPPPFGEAPVLSSPYNTYSNLPYYRPFMPPFNNFTENRPYLRSPYQINRSTCFTPKRRSKQPSRHNPHPSQLNPVVERNLNGTTVSTDRISVRISPESKDPKSFTRNHQRPIDEAKLKNAILSLMVSLGNSDASSAVEERTADPPKKLDKNSLKLENYPPNYESETEGQKLQNSSKNIIKSNDHHPTGDSSFPHDTPTENLVIDATDKTNEKNPELPINVLTDNIDEHPKKYAALSTRPNEARDDDSTGQKNIICFPANVQMATACLSNIKPVSIQSTVKNTPSVYCYRTNDLRSAGIII